MNRIAPIEHETGSTAADRNGAQTPAWRHALDREAHEHTRTHRSGHHHHVSAGADHRHLGLHHHLSVHVVVQAQHDRNIQDLARIITAEAGGESEVAMTAVGWTVRNRMARADTAHVDDVWSGFAHARHGSSSAHEIAERVLNGAAPDPTGGATHFYSPDAMPKATGPDSRDDQAGGLEQVPGVHGRHGEPVMSYRPSWSAPGQFEPRSVAGVAEHVFKFYRQPGSGHVR